MRTLYKLLVFIAAFALNCELANAQGNPSASFSFNPVAPCVGTPTTFVADTFGFTGGFSTYYNWRIDNSFVGSGNELIRNMSFGYHDVMLTVNDSILQFFDDTTMTIFVDSVCNLSTISGTAYFDLNSNGIQDPGEIGLNNGKIEIEDANNSFFTFTGSNGIYNLQINPGQYDVSIDLPGYYNITEPSISTTYQINIPSIGSTSSNNNFGVNSDSLINDLSILLSNTPLRPGFNGQIFANIRNYGTLPDTGSAVVFLDSLTPYISSIPAADSVNGNTAYYTLSNIPPNGLRRLRITTKIDSTVALNTPFKIGAFVFPTIGDNNPLDNFDTLSGVIVGSYDPNDKLVYPNDDTTNAFESGTALTYTIRFQNTGTFFAENVRLVDQIEANLDLSSFHMLGASHSYTYQVNENNRKIVWRFDNIMLPAEQNNEPESHGFVKFRISPDSALDLGDTVYNSAEIYFDFNLPIITNTIVSTLDSFFTTTSIEKVIDNSDELISLYPNPFNDEIQFLQEKEDDFNIELYSIEGERIISKEIVSKQPLNLDFLKSGLYLYKIQTDKGEIQRGKLIKN